MAENFLFGIAEGVLWELVSFLGNEIGLFWGAQKDLQKLQRTMSAIKAVLLDAEEKQRDDNRVRDWLQKLEGVVYDADDLVDDFHTEALRRRVIPGNKLTKKVCIFFSSSNQLAFRLKMGHKIKEIREALDEIRDENTFQLVERLEETKLVSAKARETHSFVREEEVIGRDNERMEILKLLLHDDATKENVSTITIVGIGGLGKTALAQLAFNDAMVQKHFETRLWVCVSDVFDLRLIAGNIIKSATNGSLDQNLAMEQLQNLLREKIERKRYFLVLDDVWNEDPKKWLDLKSLLEGGARGSRVLVTTRSEKVAMITHSFDDQPFHLSGLEKDMSWSLFAKMAFRQREDLKNPEIVDLGKAILEKCKGVPLAIKTIGSILYFKNPKTEWMSFKDNELAKVTQQENDIIPTLMLSYNHLPSYLKHCFAYCRLFPKDYKINVQMLIRLWMAQGFIKSDQNQCPEDIGYGYFLDLLWRSFFQEAEKDEWGNIRSCKMHDLMHDLATSVAGTVSVLIDKDSMNFGKNLIHVSFDSSLENRIYLKGLSSLLEHHYKLRTFFFFSAWNGKHELALKDCLKICSKFKLLRALDLSKFSCIEKLPNSLGELKHLRYLDISNLKEIQVLPDSITKLQNLQTLNLSDCKKLSSLPRDMHKMVSLRHLEIRSCHNLKSLPEAMGNLSSLHSLEIRDCPNLKSLPETMGNLSSLHSLNIRSCPNLESLPEAMGNLSSLHALEIRYCHNLKLLPEAMGNLSSLHSLEISYCYDLKSLPEAMGILSSLQSLNIRSCHSLESLPEAVGNLSSLHSLEIRDCHNLKSLPEAMGNLSSLHSLEISYCYDLKSLPEAMGNLSSLYSLNIISCHNLESLPEAMGNLSSLHSLEIRDCHNLKSLPEAMGNLSSLQCLDIRNCPNLTSLPEGQMLRTLRSLLISDCPILNQRYNKTYGEDWPKIAHIPDVQIY